MPRAIAMKRWLPIALAALLAGGAAWAQDDEDSVIDIAVFYTTAAKNAEGGTTQIEAEIDMFVAATNMAYADSGVDQRINLVYAGEVDYTETTDMEADLDRLRVINDGFLDEVHTVRDDVWADVVYLFRADHPSFYGVAYAMGSEGTSFATHAFAVSEMGGNHFAHELGHIMGLSHDRFEACGSDYCPNHKRYGYGYVNQKAFESGAATNKRWRTVMAYDNQCSGSGFSCGQIMRFSNPNQTYRGDSLGVALTDSNRGRGRRGRRLVHVGHRDRHRPGIEQGIERGRAEGGRTVLERLLRRRFGRLPSEAAERLHRAAAAELETWADNGHGIWGHRHGGRRCRTSTSTRSVGNRGNRGHTRVASYTGESGTHASRVLRRVGHLGHGACRKQRPRRADVLRDTGRSSIDRRRRCPSDCSDDRPEPTPDRPLRRPRPPSGGARCARCQRMTVSHDHNFKNLIVSSLRDA